MFRLPIAGIALILACSSPASVVGDSGNPQLPGTPGQPAPPETPVPPVTPIPGLPSTPPWNGQYAASYGTWTPSEFDTCTKEQHDAYSTVGPDGKLYPTWHPPVDPVTGCTFGHEHGKDPSGSNLYQRIGPIPFGVANEALMEYTGHMPRHEDHVGHKVEWANRLRFIPNREGGTPKTCDVLVKLHQGTHSADAFTNNLHEFAYHLACDDGAVMDFTMLAPLGSGGSFLEKCTSDRIQVGSPSPPDSPNGVDTRQIPTRHCVDKNISGPRPKGVSYIMGLGEVWPVSVAITRENGSRIAVVAVYANIANASRFYDPSKPNNLGRSIDLCYETNDPKDGRTMAECAAVRALNDSIGPFDPRSPFNGARHSVRWNQIGLFNEGEPEVYYTDPFGRHGAAAPFPGSIKQVFSSMTNGGLKVYAPGSNGGDYSAPGVHAPN